MTPSDQHADQQLTRRQLREIRMTGATPIVTPEAAAEAAANAAAQPEPSETTGAPAAEQTPTPAAPPAHLPRAAEPIAEAPAPAPDASVDLGARARTRRQARDQERIRTNSIPVLTPEAGTPVVSDQASEPASAATAPESVAASAAEEAHTAVTPEAASSAPDAADAAEVTLAAAPVVPEPVAAAVETPTADEASAAAPLTDASTDAPTFDAEPAGDADSPWAPRSAGGTDAIPMSNPSRASESIAATMATDSDAADDEHTVHAEFGANLLGQDSFDDLLVRSSTSSGSSGSASMLILPEDMSLTPLTAPVTSTGQVILTGTFSLPDGLGSQGHAPGVADGKDVDAVLIDGELAPQSSPTPIAATAAVSQAKTPVEMIRPPAPEKNSKLVVALAITAGVLSLAAIGFTIYVVTTGKF